jgi:hypothetical protein
MLDTNRTVEYTSRNAVKLWLPTVTLPLLVGNLTDVAATYWWLTHG